MQCTRQTRSGIGGDRGADRGILAARMQGAEPAGERREHVSRRNESARGPCTCAVEVDWGADPARGSGGYLTLSAYVYDPSYALELYNAYPDKFRVVTPVEATD